MAKPRIQVFVVCADQVSHAPRKYNRRKSPGYYFVSPPCVSSVTLRLNWTRQFPRIRIAIARSQNNARELNFTGKSAVLSSDRWWHACYHIENLIITSAAQLNRNCLIALLEDKRKIELLPRQWYSINIQGPSLEIIRDTSTQSSRALRLRRDIAGLNVLSLTSLLTHDTIFMFRRSLKSL